MVFYQHKKLVLRNHGMLEEEEKARKRQEEAQRQKQLKANEELFNGSRLLQFNPPLAGTLNGGGGVSSSRGAFSLKRGIEQLLPPVPSSSYDEPVQIYPEGVTTYETLRSMMEDDGVTEMEVATEIVSRAVPLSELECPFYLELPLKKVDMMESVNHPPPILPTPGPPPRRVQSGYVSSPTMCTPTFSTSLCKPNDMFAGSFSKIV